MTHFQKKYEPQANLKLTGLLIPTIKATLVGFSIVIASFTTVIAGGNTSKIVTDVADAVWEGGNHRPPSEWIGQGNHRTPSEWLNQENHRTPLEWFQGVPSRNSRNTRDTNNNNENNKQK